MTDPTPPLDEYLAALPDRVVARVNDLLTTLMDAAGAVGVAVGIGWAIWGAPWRHSVAVMVTGALVVLLSGFAQHRAAPKPPPEPESAETIPLPGAEHPGNVHILGR